jgi:hypothetical protein
MKKFEYHRDIDLTNKELNHLGNYGWELISVIETEHNIRVFFFKREIINN